MHDCSVCSRPLLTTRPSLSCHSRPSNSAGLSQYDAGGAEAAALQAALGVPVLRHGVRPISNPVSTRDTRMLSHTFAPAARHQKARGHG